ncbi:MAG: glycoside hydrolase family 15 protein [Candidatus Thermoplasmatota archaeon]|nr:glycoside hydrolase family 15 protein [Candidatus Thermoplasmatota archaeon]
MVFQGSKKFRNLAQNGYLKISNHGMIANNRTAALVGLNGTIDWACLPNFNSAPVFDSILDRNKGGYFSVRPHEAEDLEVIQYYKEFTNVLITEFLRDTKIILRITDFIPVSDYPTISFPEIHRLVETLSEDVAVEVGFKATLNYGRDPVHLEARKNGFIFQSVSSNVGIAGEIPLKISGSKVASVEKIPRRSARWLIALQGISHLDKISDYKSFQRMEETIEYWQTWSAISKYKGLYNNDVNRSALMLKGLFYEPTGLMVAAPTASLPECIGSERNWDYRFTWIRDTAYVIEALAMIGYKHEATKFLYDMMELIEREKKVRTIYSINQSNDLEEMELDYEGYMGSKPVRIGNKASTQLQVDQFGSIVNAIHSLSEAGGIINSYLWNFVGETLDSLDELWKMPDSSIWEFRTEPKHYVYSKVVSWSAFNQAIEMGKEQGFSGPYRKWKAIADGIKDDIIKNGYNEELNSFTQYYGSRETDSSLLRMPLLDFLPANDRRIRGTIGKIEKDLRITDNLFRRYREDDGLNGEDNAFLLLSFWYVEVLLKMGKTNDAKEVFDSLLDRANYVGLLAEEIDFRTGDQLGNFPQAITHLGVIRGAIMLNSVLKNGKRTNGRKPVKSYDPGRS